ncbi:Protein of unknown function [Cotesia congregata]|uniref:Uncharacterized protein n=1 Tax=Cotesia congregata TaxID=51543 RepID=A0A8J2MFS1_COTCN|nr:Protein of unknown function [Cotesia congregata]
MFAEASKRLLPLHLSSCDSADARKRRRLCPTSRRRAIQGVRDVERGHPAAKPSFLRVHPARRVSTLPSLGRRCSFSTTLAAAINRPTMLTMSTLMMPTTITTITNPGPISTASVPQKSENKLTTTASLSHPASAVNSKSGAYF